MQPDDKAEADALIHRGRALLEEGDLPTATRLLNEAVQLYWKIGDYYAAAAQTGNYGWALRRRGRPDLARPYLEQAATIFSEIGLTEFAERHRFAAEDAHAGLSSELLQSMPPAVRGALERSDLSGLQFALDALPLAERELLVERLVAAGVIQTAGGSDEATEAVRQFTPLLEGIAAVARGDETDRAEIEATLEDLERKGWHLRRSVERIWSGERNRDLLVQDLDPLDRALVEQILALLKA